MRIRCHESEMKENRLADGRQLLRRLRCWTRNKFWKNLGLGVSDFYENEVSFQIFEILVYLMPLILVKCGRAT